jgi:RAB6A-GEF complex partner protein 1
MYWPIGAPRIYAASSSKTSKNIIQVDDEAESRGAIEWGVNTQDLSSNPVRDNQNPLPEQLTPSILGIASAGQDIQNRLSTRSTSDFSDKLGDVVTQTKNKTILAIKVSRSGHLFAVVTATSLTIWQTKVRKTPSLDIFY